MRYWIGFMTLLAAATVLGCGQKAAEPAAVIEDKTYTVTPASVAVKAGMVAGEMTELKVTQRVDLGSGTAVSAPKLFGTLKLKNTSKDQAVRLLQGKLLYVDASGKPMELVEPSGQSTVSFGSYSSPERLDPGQEVSQSVEVDFPAAALEGSKLKEIQFQLAYLPMEYREETARFAVSVRGP